MESIIKNETGLPKMIKPLNRQSSMGRFSYFMNHTSSNGFSSLNLENILRDFDENLYKFSSNFNNSNSAGLENERMMIEIIKSDEIDEMLKDFILKNRVDYEHYNQAMNKTRYANKDSRKEFFEKFNKFAEITRKGYIKNNTPSFEFIKACKEHGVVPNPLGLIKRKGASNSIKLNGQRTGDEYVNVLSKGVRYVNHIKEIDLSANRLTRKGVFPLINSIKENPYLLNKLKILDLSYNKLGAPSIDKIIEYLREDDCDLQELNLEGNLLGNEPIIKLCEKISNHMNYNLSLLNLGKNSLNDDIAKDLATFVKSCHSLKVFILCWNHFKNYGASIIVNNIKRHPSLKIFDISWNCIGNKLTQEVNQDDVLKCAYKTNKNFSNFEIEEFRKTAKIISINKKEDAINKSEKMKRKKTMRMSTLNFKQQVTITPFAKEVGEYFRDPTIGLVHLDISHNNINYDDCIHMAQEVKYNHTILGIHVDGNEMAVDELGFLLPKKRVFAQKSQCADSQIYYKIGKENSLITSNIENVKKIRAKNNCWICEGWREITFSFTPDFEIKNPEAHFVKLHLSVDNWKPYDSYYSHGNYYAVRMCPPGEVSYFFTIDKTIVETTHGEDVYQLKEEFLYRFEDEYLRDFNTIQMKNIYSGLSGSPEDLESVQKMSRRDLNRQKSLVDNKNSQINTNVVRIKFLRKINVEMNNKVVDKNFFKMFNYCDPRPEKNVFQFTKPRTPWNFTKSMWASYEYKYEGEAEGLIDQMFEFDYNWGGFNKEIAEDPEGMKEVKKYLRSNYKKLYNISINIS
jgi:Ran GTPase-activating protein (RanGAP) involved in mRNA processing and transport